MRLARAAASGAFLIAIQILSPAGASEATPSYTFHVDVVMAMRHFPWLRFRLEGLGEYQPGQSYVVHFTSVPWFFPKQQHDVDLSMLDPAMWSKRFDYEELTPQRNGNRVFALHAIGDSTLKSATVTLGPYGMTHRVDATYNDGTHIQMNVTRSNVDGFLLPVTLTADIDEPHLALSANADFTNYAFAE